MNKKEFFNLVNPEGGALVLSGLAASAFLVGVLLSLLALLSAHDGLMVSTGLLLLITIPLTFLLLELAAWASRRAGPRFALGMLALFLALVDITAIIFWSASDSGSASLAVSCFGSALLSLPVILIGSIPIFLAIPRLPDEARKIIFEQRCVRAIEYIQKRDGVVSYQELSKYLGTSEPEAERILVFLLESGQVSGKRYPEHKLFLTDQALEEKYNKLVALVEAHAQMRLDDLAIQLAAPLALVRDWILSLVGQGRYSGYIHWEKGMLYSREAKTLLNLQQCPSCGGELRLAGKGIVHCEYCGADIFPGTAGRDVSVENAAPKSSTRKRGRTYARTNG